MCNDKLTIGNFPGDRPSDDYPTFERVIKETFNNFINAGGRLFTTNAPANLYETFLNNLPANGRQHYNCHECRKFVDRFGSLVTIAPSGVAIPVMWNLDETPGFFKTAVEAVINVVKKAEIDGVFLTNEIKLGVPLTGDWSHMSVTLPSVSPVVFKTRGTFTAEQMMAEHIEEYKLLWSTIRLFNIDTVNKAVDLLNSGQLARPEKSVESTEWFQHIQKRLESTKHRVIRNNIVWEAVAAAPTGFVHIKNNMPGTLMTDIVNGLSVDDLKRKFANKMDGLNYQRPKAAPTAGGIREANKLIEERGFQKSFERRFARLEEINKVWVPKEKETKSSDGGFFSHLLPKEESEAPLVSDDAKTLTWEKFYKTVLPTAAKIEYLVDSYNPNNYGAMLTATHEDAPPIIQWDKEDRRNPFSWYLYHNGSHSSKWGLLRGYVKVNAITYAPSMWYEEHKNHGKGVMFVLDGAKDSNHERIGIALFPEMLISDLRSIRSTVEEFSATSKLSGYEESTVAGIIFHDGGHYNETFRVTTDAGVVLKYKIDRWD